MIMVIWTNNNDVLNYGILILPFSNIFLGYNT
jgi:hypothetical protein